MARTVNYGIDLGTTNSAVARMTTRGIEIIPVKSHNYIASIVGVDKRGAIKVGEMSPAYESARTFKRLMGTESTIRLDDGVEWKPEELSSEVLKALRTAVKLKTEDELVEVVITIPAMFSQPQCEATNRAAQLAGLNAVALLQEPIAAATAYLSDNPIEGYYLVYDLGGGTFDVSLIRLRHGEMNVIEHGGDNYLGGTDLDRAVFEWVVGQIERNGGNANRFAKSTSRKGGDHAHLLGLCEAARVELSDHERTLIYLDDFDVEPSKLELTQQRLSDIIDPFITRTIEIAKDRLKAVPASESVKAVLLVGGPTQAQYIRTRLRSELQIPLNLDQDPMTVVAKGAAIHASSILSQTERTVAVTEAAQVELYYEPVSPEKQTVVAGKIVFPENFTGEVRLSITNGDWETGWKPLKNGAFSFEVLLGRQQVSEFQIFLRDTQGRLTPCEPNNLSIRSGVRAAQAVVPYDYSVVAEGGVDIINILLRGQPLPAFRTGVFKLSKTVVAGSSDVARIYFVEGNSLYAADNYKCGEVKIKGTEIIRTLKENETIEIRIRIDESRRVKARVYIPLIDKDYEVPIYSMLDSPGADDINASLREAQTTIKQVEKYLSDEEQIVANRINREADQIEAKLERLKKGEIEMAAEIHRQLSESKAVIRPLQQKYALIVKHERAVSRIDAARDLCKQFNDSMGEAKLEDLRSEADRCLRLEQEEDFDGIYEQALSIFWQHYGKTRGCWEYQIFNMKQQATKATDHLGYFELVRNAEKCLAENDFAGVSLNQQRSWTLLPNDSLNERRFADASIRML